MFFVEKKKLVYQINGMCSFKRYEFLNFILFQNKRKLRRFFYFNLIGIKEIV